MPLLLEVTNFGGCIHHCARIHSDAFHVMSSIININNIDSMHYQQHITHPIRLFVSSHHRMKHSNPTLNHVIIASPTGRFWITPILFPNMRYCPIQRKSWAIYYFLVMTIKFQLHPILTKSMIGKRDGKTEYFVIMKKLSRRKIILIAIMVHLESRRQLLLKMAR